MGENEEDDKKAAGGIQTNEGKRKRGEATNTEGHHGGTQVVLRSDSSRGVEKRRRIGSRHGSENVSMASTMDTKRCQARAGRDRSKNGPGLRKRRNDKRQTTDLLLVCNWEAIKPNEKSGPKPAGLPTLHAVFGRQMENLRFTFGPQHRQTTELNPLPQPMVPPLSQDGPEIKHGGSGNASLPHETPGGHENISKRSGKFYPFPFSGSDIDSSGGVSVTKAAHRGELHNSSASGGKEGTNRCGFSIRKSKVSVDGGRFESNYNEELRNATLDTLRECPYCGKWDGLDCKCGDDSTAIDCIVSEDEGYTSFFDE